MSEPLNEQLKDHLRGLRNRSCAAMQDHDREKLKGEKDKAYLWRNVSEVYDQCANELSDILVKHQQPVSNP